jgi:chemotaxis protein methyltransferase CheR
MTDEVFARFYRLLEQKTGISLDSTKNYLIESRLAEICKAQHQPNIAEFLKGLTNTPVGNLHWQVFEALTTNETMFFRDRQFFDALTQSIIPKMIERRKGERAIRISCAAVSTGQEAFSVAIALKENFPELTSWNIYIQATDLSERALLRARAGLYSKTEIERGLDAYLIYKYVTHTSSGKYQINPVIRDCVSFMPGNLLDPAPAYPKFDLILLRNVLIYFGQATKEKVLGHIHRQLNPIDGRLVLGATESILGSTLYQTEQHGKISCYAPS